MYEVYWHNPHVRSSKYMHHDLSQLWLKKWFDTMTVLRNICVDPCSWPCELLRKSEKIIENGLRNDGFRIYMVEVRWGFFLYPPHNEVVGGYIGFNLTVCLSVRRLLSVVCRPSVDKIVSPPLFCLIFIGSISILVCRCPIQRRCVMILNFSDWPIFKVTRGHQNSEFAIAEFLPCPLSGGYPRNGGRSNWL